MKFSKTHVMLATISAIIVFLMGCVAVSRGRPSEPLFALSVILYTAAASMNIHARIDKIEEMLNREHIK